MTTAAPHPTPAHELPQAQPQSTNISTAPTPHAFAVPRGPVTATLTYYAPPADNSTPYNYVETPPPGVPRSNFGSADHAITINDMRGHEADFDLDRHSFAALSNVPSEEHAFVDDATIKRVYYPEVEALLLSQLPGTPQRVLLFDHTIRRAGKADAARGPVTRVHIDQTARAALARVRHHLPHEADALLRGRVRIVNVWRALNGPVVSFPLAVADGSTVRGEDLVGVEHRYPDRVGETAGVKFEEGQRWWYWSGMGEGERLLLLCADSENERGRAPHTAFVDPRTEEGAPGRESVEVRALVFG
ncbi:uncharacterized protein K452DRAFT_289788 [Aplosporella prunicola CBS 121167]|uniref:Methyltransferase n=1 Tax=Aplosporella prunicola CBS 121167 TaxID=1176127 RepID=A0A6A6B4Y3_9PEZI|nr:uncharacterized protein K452DRAFT_289788 [Aplosporella prunicola CBS 121167]KAF2139239.1 hypothetical protein K452DRAFT_289788 [Aplosporella prunicola CBS 121167]